MIILGLTIIGRGNWTGADTYLRNMLGMLKRQLREKVRAKLFVAKSQLDQLSPSLMALLEDAPIVDDRVLGAGRLARLPGILARGTDAQAEAAFLEQRVDVVFEHGAFLGSRFQIPVAAWIPDFQHRRLPRMFSVSSRWRRHLGFLSLIHI